MPYSSEPPFTLKCDAGFRADGVWIITLTLVYRDGPPDQDSVLFGEGRLAMLRAVLDEGLRGRSLGATHVRVFLDEGTGVVTEIDPSGAVGKFGRN